MKKWELIESNTLVKNEYLELKKDSVLVPNGIVIEDFYYIKTNEASIIVATDENNNVVLKKEYRHPVGEILVELPAGTFEKGESDALAVAKRELLEETGYASDEWFELGKKIESPSKTNTQISFFWAKNVRHVDNQHLDKTEDIEVMLVSLSEAIEMCMTNEIRVNSSLTGLLMVARLLDI